MSAFRTALDPEPRSARTARRFVDDALERMGLQRLRDNALLLVSEVVTNAILHARTPITVEITVNGRTVWIGVTDRSQKTPLRREYSGDATTGRGLVLLDALAAAWGTTPLHDGKVVWFELQ